MLDVIVGGSAGDEGKGKIAAWLALHGNYRAAIRTSAPQSGHSLEYQGKRIGLATLPCAYVNSNLRLLIGRGAFINVKRLEKDFERTGLKNSERVGIDNYATIVEQKHVDEERANNHLMKNIGSVGSGAGPARRDKLMRLDMLFAKDIPELKQYLTDTVEEVHRILKNKEEIIGEYDQGFKLDLIHGEYPRVTSRSTLAASFLSEIGAGPKQVRDIYIVFKPYVTRVDQQGMENQIHDPKILEWCKKKGHEVGTESKRIRDIGEFDWEDAKRAIMTNSATKLCFTHMDWFEAIGRSEDEFIDKVTNELCKSYPYPKISLLSYGPKVDDVIDMRIT